MPVRILERQPRHHDFIGVRSLILAPLLSIGRALFSTVTIHSTVLDDSCPLQWVDLALDVLLGTVLAMSHNHTPFSVREDRVPEFKLSIMEISRDTRDHLDQNSTVDEASAPACLPASSTPA